ncbi:MAG TPA: NAD(P)/FAD-dependent oxidoreductase [bacterium]
MSRPQFLVEGGLEPRMRLTHPAKALGKHIVIVVGGGFGGLNVAKALAHRREVHVLLVDQRNHHLFQPLLYQVATAGLNPADIALPIRGVFTGVENVEVHWARVSRVNFAAQAVHIADSPVEIAYDTLVLACGVQHSYFGHAEWEDFAPGLKTLEQATEIRRRILSAYEFAENEGDPRKQAELMTFVVVGAGPTGVELAGAIADISRTVLVKDFTRIDPLRTRVVLVEGGPRVLPAFAEPLSAKTERALKQLGVEVRLNAMVTAINAEGVHIGAELIAARNAFWAAGVQARTPALEPPPEMDRAGRVKITPQLTIPGRDDVFVIGDMAAGEASPGKPLPGMAPAAIQMGKHVARQILATLHGKPRRPFRYLDKGQMATIGKNKAIVEIGRIRFSGRLAWFTWLIVHIFFLIGFRNRVAVMAQWAWSYVFSKRGARLITDREWRLRKNG